MRLCLYCSVRLCTCVGWAVSTISTCCTAGAKHQVMSPPDYDDQSRIAGVASAPRQATSGYICLHCILFN